MAERRIAQVKPLADVRPEDTERIFRINVDGVLRGIQAGAAKLQELGRKGKIINAASIAGHDGFEMLGIYSVTKFAVRALAQAAAKEYAADGSTGQSILTDGASSIADHPGDARETSQSGFDYPSRERHKV